MIAVEVWTKNGKCSVAVTDTATGRSAWAKKIPRGELYGTVEKLQRRIAVGEDTEP